MESNPDLGWRMDSSVSMNHGFASTTALACIRTRMCRLHRRLGRDQVREIACNSWPGTDHSKSEAAGPGPGARLPSPSLRLGLRLGPAYSSCMRLYYRRRSRDIHMTKCLVKLTDVENFPATKSLEAPGD
jgi:hypothetical protein